MQTEVYLTSMSLNHGAVINFNNDAGTVDVKEVCKPELLWTRQVSKQAKPATKKIDAKTLQSVAAEIFKILGHGFFYEAEASKAYVAAASAELRLRGYIFHSVAHPVQYKGLHLEDYPFDFYFPSGGIVKVVAFESEKKKAEKIEEWEAMTKRFKLKNAFLLALPQKDGDAVVVREG